MTALKQMHKPFNFVGIGGDQMVAQGLKPLLPFSDFHVMGFSDIVCAYPRLRSHFYLIAEHILKNKPEAVVLIDYAEFNLRLARHLRKAGYRGKLIQYIAPTVWAWRSGRLKQMRESLDLLLTIYPFEAAYFEGLPTKYVGNHLMQEVPYQSDWQTKLALPSTMPFIILFPGSRPGEIARNLPLELSTAELFQHMFPQYGFLISVAHPSLEASITNQLAKSSLKNCWLLPQSLRHSAMQEAAAALAKSGTITLELALHNCPTVVLYKLSRLNCFLAKYLFRIKLPFYALPNILLNENLFPEWFGCHLDPRQLADSLQQQLNQRALLKNKTDQLKNLLTHKNASQEAAKSIYEILT
jgi:lipid-A-disaccharide synthase